MNGAYQEFGSESPDYSSRNRNAFVCFLHIFFRLSAIVLYLLCSILTSKFVTPFVFILLLLSLDFWLVKNITGRILVKLRWWNCVSEENGESEWVFERNDHIANIPALHSTIFWNGLIISPLIWIIFFFTALFSIRFNWLVLVLLALVLNASNLYGYLRCKMGDNKSIKDGLTSMLAQKALFSLFSRSPAHTQMPV